ncbi:MAG: prohibitin family protein [Nitrospirales bacterium]|nr:prohibitin family protein [Nitrospira sp.]MDR4502893.1 prohibitin family protein [Nitrospirales bacterium]
MKSLSWILYSGLIIGILSSVGCGVSVKPGERGLRWHPLSEGLMKEPLKDGFYWRAPWNDIYVYPVQWGSYNEKVDALSSDDLQVNLKSAIIIRPIPEEIYFLVQEVGSNWYTKVVQPEFLSAVRSVISGYPMVSIPERSTEIAHKIQAVLDEKLTDRHLEIRSVALSDIEWPQMVLKSIELKQAKEQENEQKDFELIIANKDAEIARRRAKGEGDSLKIRAEGEAASLRIRAEGQAKAQETIAKTLTDGYLRFKLYDSSNSKFVLLPNNLQVPLVLNPSMASARQEEMAP